MSKAARPPVIDMRCRPSYLHEFFGAVPGSPQDETARWINRRVGTRGDDAHYIRSRTREGFVAEVEAAGLSRAVIVGRNIPGQELSNDLIHRIASDSPRFIGIGAVNPLAGGEGAALAEVDRAIKTLGLAGIDLEPGFLAPARHADDRALFPVYERCAALNVPVFLMTGPTTPDPRYNDPAAIAAVARAFPQLPIVCYHGWWPRVQEAIGVAWRYENVYLVPDMYLFVAGSGAYLEAARGFLGDQLLFGSSYPFRPIGQSIDDLLALVPQQDLAERILWKNAARLFKLGGIAPRA